MANIIYPWNPFQEIVVNDIKQEVIKTSDILNRVEFIPRAAPFFSRNFVLYRQGSVDPLILGYDYCFAHTFNDFINIYNRNAFGSVIMLRPVAGDVLLANYSTLGAGFVLDQVTFAALVANIVNAPRGADWADLVPSSIPLEFPPDPHPHPVSQTYDYVEMITQLKSLVLAVTDTTQTATVKSLLEEHLGKELVEAHAATAEDLGLPLTPNMGAATQADLAGSSANLLVTMDVLKAAFRLLAAGTLTTGSVTPPPVVSHTGPTTPTTITVAATVHQSSTGNTLTVTGSTASDGATVTYSLLQAGSTPVSFSKTIGIIEGEVVFFTAPTVNVDTPITISAVALDSMGAISSPIAVTVTIQGHITPTPPTTLTVPATVYQQSTGNTLTVKGATASDGATHTYSLTQSGGAVVTFSKTTGILAGEVVTFTAPAVSSDTTIVISATAVDSMGAVSTAKTANVTILKHIAPTAPTIVTVASAVYQGTTGNTISVGGSVAADGATLTYSLTQSGGAAVTFSKTTGITAGSVITFTAPAVTTDTPIVISVTAVDSLGSVSTPTSVNVTITQSASLGFGQSWKNVTGSRTLGVIYTNTSGSAIGLSVIMNSAATEGYTGIEIVVGGVQVWNGYFTPNGSVILAGGTAIVPAGATYVVTQSANAGYVQVWSELR